METQIHSNAVQEIISRPPAFLIKCGIYIIIASIVLLIISSFFISYPQVIEQRIIINAMRKSNCIVPEDSLLFIGQLSVPSSQYGQIKQGQNVCIKLIAYPYLEYGSLNGYISSISNAPNSVSDALLYEVSVDIPDNLRTTMGISLPFATKLEGVAEIEVDRRLLSDILFPFISKWEHME